MAAAVDLVVIGGGITGTNAALHAARRGLSVQLIERRTIASVQSGHSAGMIGTHRGSSIKVELAHLAMPVWQDFPSEYGTAASPFVNTGRIYLYPSALEDAARAAMALQAQFGHEVRIVDETEIRAIEPTLDPGEGALIVWEPGAGTVDPAAATRGCAAAARREGVLIAEHCRATALAVAEGRVVGVETDGGFIACGAALVATSAWAPQLLLPLGIVVPIAAKPAPAVYLRRTGDEGQAHRTVSDLIGIGYARDIGAGISMVGSEPEDPRALADPDANIEAASWGTVRRLKAHFGRLFPVFRDSVILGGNQGLYDVTPDGHPIVDRIGSVSGLFLIAGFSGDGFKYGPALGRLLAEWLADGEPSIDLSPLRLARFEEGDLIPPEFPGVSFEGTSHATN